MRIDINLASQKYQDAREFYLRWAGALALVLAATLGLALWSWTSYKNSGRDNARIRELEERIAALDRQRADAEAILNKPENQDVRDQSQFWNGIIDQKSFSWTQLFSDLEKIMPSRASVANAEPEITPERRLRLKLIFIGEKHDDALELFRRMERSERFREPVLKAEQVRTLGSGPGAPVVVQFEIVTFYTPASPGEKTHETVARKGA